MNVTFEKMRLEHLNDILKIEKLSFPSPWSRSSFLYEITQNQFACYIVAMAEEKVAGWWNVVDYGRGSHNNVAVHPDYRMNRIGTALMKELIRLASLMGATRMTLA